MDKKILIADIDENVMLMMEAALSVRGYYVTTALTGKEAFNRIRKERPDLVILDTALPEMSGYQVVNKMHGEDDLKKIPIIIMSEKAQMRDLFTSAEIHAFMTKPVLPKELMKEVDLVLRHETKQTAQLKSSVATIGMESAVYGKLKSFLMGKGYVLLPDQDLESILATRPRYILAPFQEGPGGGPAGEIYRELKRRKQSHFFFFFALCPEPLFAQALKELPLEYLIKYRDVTDLCEQLFTAMKRN
jgi:two-component system, OmpR family, alkaline phosphatase synthesis response regulator PhoP